MSNETNNNEGPLAVITGAARGIGAAIAQRLSDAGYAVAIWDYNEEGAAETAAALVAAGRRAVSAKVDVADFESASEMVREAGRAMGGIDVLVHCAGIALLRSIFKITPAEWRHVIDVNLMGTLYAARAAALQFKAQNSGHLIVMSSIVARRGIAGSSVYSATKAAQAGLVESLRAEWHGTPLRASAVYPVSTATEFHDAIQRDYGFEVHGMGPKQQASSVADAVVRCIDRPRPEVYPYGRARLLSILNILAPGMADRLVQRFSRRRRQ